MTEEDIPQPQDETQSSSTSMYLSTTQYIDQLFERFQQHQDKITEDKEEHAQMKEEILSLKEQIERRDALIGKY